MRLLRRCLCACVLFWSLQGLAAAADLVCNNAGLNISLPSGSAGQSSVFDNSTTLTNNGAVNHSFNVSADQSWLSASPSSGNLTAGSSVIIKITGDPKRLPPKNAYTGKITITGNNQTFTINVSFVVQGTNLSVNGDGNFGTIQPSQQVKTIQVGTSGGNTGVKVTVTQGNFSGKLSAGPNFLAPKPDFQITIVAGSLAPGDYNGGQIALQWDGANGSPFVEVDIGVSAHISALQTSSAITINVTADAGSAATTQPVTLVNASSSNITVTGSSDVSWLTAPAQLTLNGNTASGVNLTIDPGKVQASQSAYSGHASFSSGGDSVTFTVNLTSKGVVISSLAAPGAFSVPSGQKKSAGLIVGSAGATLKAAAASNPAGWLTVDNGTSSGVNQVTFQITVDADSLSPGPYSGTVTVSCTGQPACVPLSTTINVTVTPGPASLTTADPTSLTFTQNPDGSISPTSQQVHIKASDNTSSLAFSYNSPATWLLVKYDQLSTPATLTLSTTGQLPKQATGTTVTVNPANGTTSLVISVQFVINTSPVITSMVVTSSQSPTIAQNTWIEIHGNNLATVTQDWSNEDFSKGLPVKMAGVSATVNNKLPAVFYVSPTQINVLTPLDSATGQVPVQVTNAAGQSNIVNVTETQVSPGFLVFDVPGHVVAEHSNYSLLGPVSMSSPGYDFTPAQPNEQVILYCIGFGQTSPAITNQLTGSGQLPKPWPVVTIGGLPATVNFAGLVTPGLYQLNVVVPAGAQNGELRVSATYNGGATQAVALLAVQH